MPVTDVRRTSELGSVALRRRSSRLSLSLSGTNLERAGDYNLRTVLQAIRLGGETTRVDLAQQTGLTAPTIANITGRLAEMGLIRSAGRRVGGRGQPAMRLVIDPDGAFGIGLTIDRDHLTLVTLDLAGEVRSRVTREMAFALPQDVVAFVHDELDGAVRSGGVDRGRVLGLGVAIPDEIGQMGWPGRPAAYDAWHDTDVVALLEDSVPWPVHVDNDAAAAALGEAQCGTVFEHPSFFYLLISVGLGGGPVFDRTYHRGATHRSGEIGLMPDPSGTPGAVVQDTVSLSTLLARLDAAGFPGCGLDQLVDGTDGEQAVIDAWLHDCARALTAPLVAINCLINPDAILIGGRLPMPLIQRLSAGLTTALQDIKLPSRAKILPAVMAEDAPAIGAAILPFLDHVLPSDAILIQAGR